MLDKLSPQNELNYVVAIMINLFACSFRITACVCMYVCAHACTHTYHKHSIIVNLILFHLLLFSR